MEEEQEEQKPKQRGGRREGAGRKAKGGEVTHRIAFRASKDVYEILTHLDEGASMTEFIERAIKERWRRLHY